ncbi:MULTISPECIES: molecular chaperone DnaJ [Synechococcaceae]|nr:MULTISPECIES: molecular chaperone DnaJ [Synechococcaceae]MCT4364306.1 molecular chaperone DnaJ [Candidatus Regnicoccus frigidus MAG-AL1]MCT4368793.1 molecular chaperone DnaJ [Candidatus Regnicoccus frigidus MAG-AL2]
MPQVLSSRRDQLVAQKPQVKASGADPSPASTLPNGKGFGFGRQAAGPQASRGKGRKRKGSGLAAADRSPLGKSPDLEALGARQLLGLALAGRLSVTAVTRAWKQAAASHHPDRGGEHTTMQAINGARDALLGRS